MALLSIDNLSIRFGGVQALSDIALEVQSQQIVTIIGPNGSGKTTLFNCISAVYRPQLGRILFYGEDLLSLATHRVAQRGVARTFQNLRLFMHMTVLDNLLLGRHIKFNKNPWHAVFRLRKEEIKHRRVVEELIDFLQLEAYRKTRVSDCPYGVQKIAELGRALALEPKLLMLDEPFSGLTAEEKHEVAYLIHEIRGRFKPAILLVEHDLRLASTLADTMVALVSGKKVAMGSPPAVLNAPEVVSAYIGGA
ncbi:MAG: ABC transporter ATP-binding protein [Deltaproteobacteria bacterium]|nr:ABC transporter ATP-binding protein [Deltaproteobacteria bacterium]